MPQKSQVHKYNSIKRSSVQITKQHNEVMGKRCKPSTPQLTTPEEEKNLLLQGARDHLHSSPVGLEHVPVGMILLLDSHHFDWRESKV